jgi:peptidoglycan/LPS O-acetylase OafA/YrhL
MNHTGRIPGLDGLRGIAALAVVAFHFDIFFVPQARLAGILPGVSHAYLAVDLFFLMSGFVVAHVYGAALAANWREHWRDFAIARFARLYPVFAVTLVVMIAAVVLSHEPLTYVSFSARTLALQPLMLQQWASGLSWNYPSWSISTETEAYVYFVFFAALLIRGRYPRIVAACCGLVLVALSLKYGGSLNYFVGPGALLRTLAEFTLGVLLYRFNAGNTRVPYRWVALPAVLLIGAALVTHLDFLMVAGFVGIIYYCVNAPNELPCRLLNSRPAVALGNWSYSVYLWHAPTQYCVMATFAAFGHPVAGLSLSSARLLVLATTLAIVGIAALHYEYFEKPMRRMISNLAARIRHVGKVDATPPVAPT